MDCIKPVCVFGMVVLFWFVRKTAGGDHYGIDHSVFAEERALRDQLRAVGEEEGSDSTTP